MARTKPQEIIRRAQVPQRLAERPVLAVQADQASSAGAGVLSHRRCGADARLGFRQLADDLKQPRAVQRRGDPTYAGGRRGYAPAGRGLRCPAVGVMASRLPQGRRHHPRPRLADRSGQRDRQGRTRHRHRAAHQGADGCADAEPRVPRPAGPQGPDAGRHARRAAGPPAVAGRLDAGNAGPAEGVADRDHPRRHQGRHVPHFRGHERPVRDAGPGGVRLSQQARRGRTLRRGRQEELAAGDRDPQSIPAFRSRTAATASPA